MMYKSPIEIVMGQLKTEQENHIVRAIQEMSVNVDKDELIKALMYDRKQYVKGYADGIKEFAERLKAISHPYGDTQMVFELQIDNLVKEMMGEV